LIGLFGPNRSSVRDGAPRAARRLRRHDGHTDTERPDPSTLDVHELDRAEVELQRQYGVTAFKVARGDDDYDGCLRKLSAV
jgi:hypothetical protein